MGMDGTPSLPHRGGIYRLLYHSDDFTFLEEKVLSQFKRRYMSSSVVEGGKDESMAQSYHMVDACVVSLNRSQNIQNQG